MTRADRALARAYRALLRLLPGATSGADRAEMVQVFADQLRDSRGSGRARVALRAFTCLPWVLILEWRDALRRAPEHPTNDSRGQGGERMGTLIRNIKYALRTLRRSPTFTLASVLLLALGVGAVTSVFTIVDHVLLRPLPYAGAERLVYMTQGAHNGETLRRLDGVPAFEAWTAASSRDVNLTRDDGPPLRMRAAEVTPEFFTLFGARPLHGRLLVEGDHVSTEGVVLSHEFWSSVWGRDPSVVGSTIRIDGAPRLVLGVVAEGFVQPEALVGRGVAIFESVPWNDPELENPGHHRHNVVARLAPDATLETGDEQLEAVADAVAATHADYYGGEAPRWPLQRLRETTVAGTRRGLLLLLAAVSLLLLVACFNVASLFMARSLARGHEMAIRRALGAGTRILSGELLVESLVVGVFGGALGVTAAWGGLEAFRATTSALPRGTSISLDGRVLLVAAGLAILTALVFGLVPALRTIRGSGGALRQTATGTYGRGVSLARNGLVVAEVALSLVLVAFAGLLGRSLSELTSLDPGVEPDGVRVVRLTLEDIETGTDYLTRMEPIRRALEGVPGVASVTYGLEAPFEFTGGNNCCWSTRMPLEEGGEPVRVSLHPAKASHFETYGTEIVAGRVWTAGDVPTEPWPVVVSEQLARRLFGSPQAAIGGAVGRSDDPFGHVVGVAEATLHYGLDQSHEYAAWVPVEVLPWAIGKAVVGLRIASTGDGFGERVREAIWSVEPNLPVPSVDRLEQWIDDSSSARRVSSMLSGAFAVVALALAAGGLYATLLFAVSERRRELGIRLALGAGRTRIQYGVVRRGLTMTAAGVAIGLVGAAAAARFAESFLFGVTAHDAVSLSLAIAVLLATAAVASWLPAFRASRTDPLETMRAE